MSIDDDSTEVKLNESTGLNSQPFVMQTEIVFCFLNP